MQQDENVCLTKNIKRKLLFMSFLVVFMQRFTKKKGLQSSIFLIKTIVLRI